MRRAVVVSRQVAPQAAAGGDVADEAAKADADALFQRADANGDGKIDRDELLQIATELKTTPPPKVQPQSFPEQEELLKALMMVLPPKMKFKLLTVKQKAKEAFRGGVPVSQIKDVLQTSSVPSIRISGIVKELEEDENAFRRREQDDRARWKEEQRIDKVSKTEAKQTRRDAAVKDCEAAVASQDLNSLRRAIDAAMHEKVPAEQLSGFYTIASQLERNAENIASELERETENVRLRSFAVTAGLAVSAVAALVGGVRKLRRHIQRRLPRCFTKSNYKRIYDATQVPRFADEMHSATRNFLRSFARQHNVCEHDVDEFYERLFSSAVSAGGTEEMLNREQRSSYAVRVWTSAETMAVHGNQREFCSMLQQVIREDGGEDEDTHARQALKHAAVLCRAINEVLCRGRGNQSSVTWPSGPNCADSEARSTEANVTWRGGGLPARHKEFYTPGKKFRTDMFVATSFHLEVAQDFWRRAQEDPVEFKVTFGAGKVCRHVNFISGVSLVDDEKEFLFPPYSVFEVIEVHWSEDLAAEPHRVVLRAAMDNMHDPEDLPVSPWI